MRRITINPGQDRDPVWHPGGNIIVFSSFEKEQRTEVENFGISMYDFNDEKFHAKNGPIRLTVTRQEQQETNPSFSPDGKKLAYYISDKISEIKPGSGDKVNIEWGAFGPPEKPDFTISLGPSQYFATDVVPDIHGPVWGSNSESVVFVKYDVENYFPIVAARVNEWTEGRTEYMDNIDTNTRQNSHIIMLHQDSMPLSAVFVALDGNNYCIYTMDLTGDYFPISTEDYVAQNWINRPKYPWSGFPWYRQKKYQVLVGTGLAGIIYYSTTRTTNGDGKNIPIGLIPPVPLPPTLK